MIHALGELPYAAPGDIRLFEAGSRKSGTSERARSARGTMLGYHSIKRVKHEPAITIRSFRNEL